MKTIITFIVFAAITAGVYIWQGNKDAPLGTASVPTDTTQSSGRANESLACSEIVTPAELNAVFKQNGTAKITTRGDMCDWEIKNPSGPRYSATDIIGGSFSIVQTSPEDIESIKELRVRVCTPINTLRKTPAPIMLDIGEYSCLTDGYTPIVHVYWENKSLVITLGTPTNDDSLNDMYKKGMIAFAQLIFSRVK